MNLLLDSFWRAVAYCLHPRVIALSVLPLALMVAAAFGLGYFFWDAALDAVRVTLESWALVATLIGWLESAGLPGLKSVLAPLVVVLLATPLIVVVSLLVVALLMSPSILSLVAERRFPTLEKKHGGSLARRAVRVALGDARRAARDAGVDPAVAGAAAGAGAAAADLGLADLPRDELRHARRTRQRRRAPHAACASIARRCSAWAC